MRVYDFRWTGERQAVVASTDFRVDIEFTEGRLDGDSTCWRTVFSVHFTQGGTHTVDMRTKSKPTAPLLCEKILKHSVPAEYGS